MALFLAPRRKGMIARALRIGTLASWSGIVAVLLVDIVPADAAARNNRTRFERIRDCEHIGRQQFMRRDPTFRRFVIDRAHFRADPYGAHIGNRFVATVYSGRATYESAFGTRTTRFICLHGGIGRRALHVFRIQD